MNLQTCEDLLELAKNSLRILQDHPRCLSPIDLAQQYKLNSDGQLNLNYKHRLLVELKRLSRVYTSQLLGKSNFTICVCMERLENQVMTADNISQLLNDPQLAWETASCCRDWLELRIRNLKSNKPKLSSYVGKSISATIRLPMYLILNDSKALGYLGLSNRTTNRDTEIDKQMALMGQMTNNQVFQELCDYARHMGTRFAPTLTKMWKISQMDNDTELMVLFHEKIEYRLDISFWFYLRSLKSQTSNFLLWLNIIIESCQVRDRQGPKHLNKQQIFSHLMPLKTLMHAIKSLQ